MINFTAWPEMLAWPYLIINGWLPYKDIAIAHNPFLIFKLVVFFKIFGLGILQLKIFTWILIAINLFLTFFVTKKYWHTKTAIFASLTYLLLLLVFEGNGLWFDLALTPFVLLLYYFVQEKKYFYAGIIFAAGFFTKQTFIYLAIPVVLSLLTKYKINIKNLSKWLMGVGVITTIYLIVFYTLGILDDYYNWAIKFGILYLPNAYGQVSLPSLKQFVFALLPFAGLFLTPSLIPWAIVSSLGVYPRWEMFHFQPALPFVAISFSIFIFSKKNKLLKALGLLLMTFYLIFGLNREVGSNTRFYESHDVKIVEEIKTINPDDIYVVNYWDNIYALSNELPGTRPLIPYIPWYLDYQDNRGIIMNDLKVSMPEVILVNEKENINFVELSNFIDRLYSCNNINEKIELCRKN